jgi:microcystin-dependent protein
MLEKNIPTCSYPFNSNSRAGPSNNLLDNLPALSLEKIYPFKPPHAVKANKVSFNTRIYSGSEDLSGEDESFDNMPPYQSISFIICIDRINPGWQ